MTPGTGPRSAIEETGRRPADRRRPVGPIVLDFSLVAPGGATSHATGFLDALAGAGGCDGTGVLVLLPRDPEALAAQEAALRAAGIDVLRTSTSAGGTWRSRIDGQVALPLLARRIRPSVVYLPREVGPLALRAPTVLTATNVLRWGHRSPDRSLGTRAVSWLKTAVAERAVRRARVVVAISRSIADLLPDGVRVEVIPLGVDVDPVPPDPQPLSTRRPVRLATLGSLTPHKRLDLVIDAVEILLRDHGVDARLDLWGPAPSRQIEEDLDARLAVLGGRGRRRGPVDRAGRQEMLASTDVLVVGSGTESFGFPMIEAMRTSTLVLAPDAPVVRDACGDVAVTYPEGDPAAAAAALAAVLGDDDATAARIEEGRIRAELFTWDRCVRDTLDLLRSVGSVTPP